MSDTPKESKTLALVAVGLLALALLMLQANGVLFEAGRLTGATVADAQGEAMDYAPGGYMYILPALLLFSAAICGIVASRNRGRANREAAETAS